MNFAELRRRARELADGGPHGTVKFVGNPSAPDYDRFGIDISALDKARDMVLSGMLDAALERMAKGGSSPPEQPASPRPVCACGQTVWNNGLDYDGHPICRDCVGDRVAELYGTPAAALDSRIRAAQADADATSDWSAWSHPSSDGEQW